MSAVLDFGMGCIIPLLHSAEAEPDVKQTFIRTCIKVRKGAKIRNRYIQVPHLTQDTNGKVTSS